MQIDPDALPDDPALLQQMLRTVLQQQGELHAENDRLRLLIQRLSRHQFGRRSEQLTDEQLQLGLEDLEQTVAENQAAQDAAQPNDRPTPRRSKSPARNHGALPAHLPRYEVVIDPAPENCPCCGGTMHRIGELCTEQLDIVPAQLRVRVTRRARYACRACEEAVVAAPAPARPIVGGMPTEAMIVHVLVSKFCDSLPLYRQAQMLGRQGIALDRSTLAHWVGTACWWLAPLYDLVVSTVLSSPKVFADDTGLPVLDPGRGRTKTGRLWCYAVDDRPWCGPSHPAVAYVYAEDRKAIRPAAHLASFDGVLQVDGYNGFKRLAGERADNSVKLAFCWVHMRRPFYQFHASTRSPIAAELLARVASLYEIEAEIRGSPAEHRRAVRDARSRPIVEALHVWLEEQLPRLPGSSDLAKAMRYALRHWPGLVAFLDDGRIEMDTNVVERAIRPVTLNRKNILFAGSDGGARHWAIAMTLIATAKLNGVEPNGVADGCAGARRLGAHQGERTGQPASLELEAVERPRRAHRHGRVMIDNPAAAMDLLDKLQAVLPVPTRLTPEVRASLASKNAGAPVPPDGAIVALHYVGDEGGIVCRLDLGAAMQNEAFVSITHLRFDPRLPLARKIAAYQKHRVKHLRRQAP